MSAEQEIRVKLLIDNIGGFWDSKSDKKLHLESKLQEHSLHLLSEHVKFHAGKLWNDIEANTAQAVTPEIILAYIPYSDFTQSKIRQNFFRLVESNEALSKIVVDLLNDTLNSQQFAENSQLEKLVQQALSGNRESQEINRENTLQQRITAGLDNLKSKLLTDPKIALDFHFSCPNTVAKLSDEVLKKMALLEWRIAYKIFSDKDWGFGDGVAVRMIKTFNENDLITLIANLDANFKIDSHNEKYNSKYFLRTAFRRLFKHVFTNKLCLDLLLQSNLLSEAAGNSVPSDDNRVKAINVLRKYFYEQTNPDPTLAGFLQYKKHTQCFVQLVGNNAKRLLALARLAPNPVEFLKFFAKQKDTAAIIQENILAIAEKFRLYEGYDNLVRIKVGGEELRVTSFVKLFGDDIEGLLASLKNRDDPVKFLSFYAKQKGSAGIIKDNINAIILALEKCSVSKSKMNSLLKLKVDRKSLTQHLRENFAKAYNNADLDAGLKRNTDVGSNNNLSQVLLPQLESDYLRGKLDLDIECVKGLLDSGNSAVSSLLVLDDNLWKKIQKVKGPQYSVPRTSSPSLVRTIDSIGKRLARDYVYSRLNLENGTVKIERGTHNFDFITSVIIACKKDYWNKVVPKRKWFESKAKYLERVGFDNFVQQNPVFRARIEVEKQKGNKRITVLDMVNQFKSWAKATSANENNASPLSKICSSISDEGGNYLRETEGFLYDFHPELKPAEIAAPLSFAEVTDASAIRESEKAALPGSSEDRPDPQIKDANVPIVEPIVFDEFQSAPHASGEETDQTPQGLPLTRSSNLKQVLHKSSILQDVVNSVTADEERVDGIEVPLFSGSSDSLESASGLQIEATQVSLESEKPNQTAAKEEIREERSARERREAMELLMGTSDIVEIYGKDSLGLMDEKDRKKLEREFDIERAESILRKVISRIRLKEAMSQMVKAFSRRKSAESFVRKELLGDVLDSAVKKAKKETVNGVQEVAVAPSSLGLFKSSSGAILVTLEAAERLGADTREELPQQQYVAASEELASSSSTPKSPSQPKQRVISGLERKDLQHNLPAFVLSHLGSNDESAMEENLKFWQAVAKDEEVFNLIGAHKFVSVVFNFARSDTRFNKAHPEFVSSIFAACEDKVLEKLAPACFENAEFIKLHPEILVPVFTKCSSKDLATLVKKCLKIVGVEKFVENVLVKGQMHELVKSKPHEYVASILSVFKGLYGNDRDSLLKVIEEYSDAGKYKATEGHKDFWLYVVQKNEELRTLIGADGISDVVFTNKNKGFLEDVLKACADKEWQSSFSENTDQALKYAPTGSITHTLNEIVERLFTDDKSNWWRPPTPESPCS